VTRKWPELGVCKFCGLPCRRLGKTGAALDYGHTVTLGRLLGRSWALKMLTHKALPK
jgi:hypothetical protein